MKYRKKHKKISSLLALTSWCLPIAGAIIGSHCAYAQSGTVCDIDHNYMNHYAVEGGGAESDSNLPQLFYAKWSTNHIALNDHLLLNSWFYTLPPANTQTGMTCSQDLHGSGINPGSSINDPDLHNDSIKIGSNSYGSIDRSEKYLQPNGIEVDNSSDFDESEDSLGD